MELDLILRKGYFRFAKNGEILCGVAKVGTWNKRDIWKENGGRRNRWGCLLVHYLWEATLNDGRGFIAYTRKELCDGLEGKCVKVNIKENV